MRRLNNFFIACLIFVIGALLCSIFIVRHFQPDEAQLALSVQQMLHHGWQLFPKTYDNTLATNFSTVPTLAWLPARLIGHFSVFSMVVPFALAAGITLAFTYLIGATRSRAWGLVAALFVLTTEQFFLSSRSLSVSVFLTMLSAITLYVVIEFELMSVMLYIALFCLFVLGFLVQGVLGVTLLFLLVGVYLSWRLQFKKLLFIFVDALIVITIGFVALWIAANQQGGASLVSHILTSQLDSLLPKTTTGWFSDHWLDLVWYCISLPIAIITIILRWPHLIWPKAEWNIQLLRALITWAALIILLDMFWGWSANILLLMTPALGLTAAYLFYGEHTGPITQAVKKLLLQLFVLVPFIGLAITLSFFASDYFKHNAPTPFYLDSIVLLILFCAFAVFFGARRKKAENASALWVMGLASLAYVVVNVGVVEPVLASRNHTADFVKNYQQLQQKTSGDTVFYDMQLNQQTALLMVNLNEKTMPDVVQSPLQIPKRKQSYFITTQLQYNAIPAAFQQQTKIMLHGNLGNTPVLVFRYKPVKLQANDN